MEERAVDGSIKLSTAIYDGSKKLDNTKVTQMNDMVAANEKGVAELTPEELTKIAEADGKAGLSEADFAAYGVKPEVAKDIIKMATQDGGTKFKTVGLQFQVPEGSNAFVPPRLNTAISTPLRATIIARGIKVPVLDAAGKPVIDPATKKPQMKTVTNLPEFDKYLQGLPEAKRNTIIASITYDTGAEMTANEVLADKKNDALFDKFLGTDSANPTLQTLPSSLSTQDCLDVVTAYTTHPNLDQGQLNKGLSNLGTRLNAKGNEKLKATVLAELNKKYGFNPPLTDLTNVKDRNMLIEAQRSKNLAAVDAHANNLYKTLGGTEPMPISLSLASGDGTGTNGRNGVLNRGIAYNRYGSNAGFVGTSQNLSGIDQARVTFKPSAPDKPMTINIEPSGANQAQAQAEGPNGNRLSIEYKDKNGNAQSIDFITYVDPATKTTKMKLANPITDPNIKFDENSGTLTFLKPGSNPISVVQRSGDLPGKDEIFANLTLTGCTEIKNTEVNIALKDHFKPNQWDIDISKLPDFKAKVKEVVAYQKANHTQPLTTDVKGNGAGTLVNGEVAKRPKGDVHGGYGDANGSAAANKHLRYSELTYDMKTGQIEVDSFTDPVRATLTEAGYGDQVATMKAKDPGLTENDILSGLRAFSVFETYEKEANANGANMDELKNVKVPIGSNGAVMTYADYVMFNTQRDALAKK
jgi:hypothetical protein